MLKTAKFGGNSVENLMKDEHKGVLDQPANIADLPPQIHGLAAQIP